MKENNRKAIARRARQRKQRARRVALTLCLIVATMLVSVGGTIAWLADKTESVVNTFTAGDINITLGETTEEYKVVPGVDIDKDPVVTVLENSEACWLFVKIEKAHWNENMTYTVAEGWTPLTGADGVYYREVSAADATDGKDYPVLKDNKVVVSSELTKTECEAINKANPTLTFTAYAVQSDKITDVNIAWTQAQNSANY